MQYEVAGPERSRRAVAPAKRFAGGRWRSSLCLGMLIAAHPGAAALADTPAKDDAQKKRMYKREPPGRSRPAPS